MKRKSLFLIAMTVVLATVINLFAGIVAFADGATTTFAGGDGTAQNPYQIETPEQLNAVRNNLKAHFILNKDIDLNGQPWTPIGPASAYNGGNDSFAGTFDGNGHKIYNFTMTGKDVGWFGFFTIVPGTTVIKNLTIDDATIAAENCSKGAGVLIGQIEGAATISNCVIGTNVTVTTTGGSYGVGGFVGFTNGSTIENCVNNANITWTSGSGTDGAFVGGLIGRTQDTTVQYCVSNANITAGTNCTATYRVGGVVGGGTTSSVSYCVNNGDVSLVANNEWGNAGGIVGYTSTGTQTIDRCVNNGNIVATKGIPGGILGQLNTANDGVTNNYNFGTVEGGAASGSRSYVAKGQILGLQLHSISNEKLANNIGVASGVALRSIKPGGPTWDASNVTMQSTAIVKSDAYKTLATAMAAKNITLAATATDLVGYQTSEVDGGEFNLRMVAVVGGELANCTNVGFEVKATYGTDTVLTPDAFVITTVYNSISGVTDTEKVEYTAAQLGGDHLFVLACKGLPANETITFTVTTFYSVDGVRVDAAVETFTVTNVPSANMPEVVA